jgi:hypothetical protein
MIEELDFGGPGDIKNGAPKGMRVKRVQEWLQLHGIGIKVDREFGPATEACVRRYQEKQGLPVTGVVDKATFDSLVAPMRAALKPIDPAGKTLNDLIVAYGLQHVAQHPLEVGGANCGPWVRLYMDGNEGAPWFWCAGFATYPIKQAAETIKAPMPVLRSFSVANIAHDAEQKQRFLAMPVVGPKRNRITPGSLFLEEGGPTGFMHCGIVVDVRGDSMDTLEGNSNDDGSANGFEVLQRARGFKRMDFAVV